MSSLHCGTLNTTSKSKPRRVCHLNAFYGSFFRIGRFCDNLKFHTSFKHFVSAFSRFRLFDLLRFFLSISDRAPVSGTFKLRDFQLSLKCLFHFFLCRPTARLPDSNSRTGHCYQFFRDSSHLQIHRINKYVMSPG